jgi:hypothetical protein
MMEELALRMYFFVPYNISPIQQAIQSGHAALEYARLYGNTKLFKDFVEKHKTWIILNGGTTNNDIDVRRGSLQLTWDSIRTFNNEEGYVRNNPSGMIKASYFSEPDLNDAMTAFCFICDERVWNYKDYPEFVDYMINVIECDTKHYLANYDFISIKTKSKEELQQMYPEQYNIWLKNIGGESNLFLRELLKGKKLA